MHASVLKAQSLEALNIKPDGTYVDLTGGAGGHAEEILKRLSPKGRLQIYDQDPKAAMDLQKKFGGDARVKVVGKRFSEFFQNLKEDDERVDGLLADLGFSSVQMDDPQRGLSFNAEGPLDMRLDPRCSQTAADLVNTWSEKELADLFFEWGEERHSRRMARAIVADRNEKPFRTTRDLSGLAQRVLGRYYRTQRIHPATRIFMALRIAVNEELKELESLLQGLEKVLKPGGRAAIISFHSLEDRMVKKKFKELELKGWKRVTKKPMVPDAGEMGANPRSRSAKLRVIERMPCLES